MLIFPIVLLLLLLLLLGFLAWQFYAFMSLDWPRKMSFHSFQFRVKWILKRRGWDIIEPNMKPFPLFAKKISPLLTILCLHDRDSLTPLKLADFAAEKKIAGGKQIICITAEPYSDEFRDLARAKCMYVMHYKQLMGLAGLKSSNPKHVSSYFEKLNLSQTTRT